MPSRFYIRILSRERPRDASALVVSATLPRVDFIGERGAVGQTTIKALAVKDTDFDFRHPPRGGFALFSQLACFGV